MGRALPSECWRPRICRGRRTQSSAILAIAGQIAKAALIQIQGSKNYSFDDFKNDLTERGAVSVVNATTFRRYPWSFEPGHPTPRPQQMLRVSVYAAGDASITCMEEAIPAIRSIRNPEARNSSSN
jgi:hypothetical protein